LALLSRLFKFKFQLYFTAGVFIATIAVTAFRALGVNPGKIATPRIEPGSVVS